MRFTVEASVGNADGIFDAAYDFGCDSGEEAQLNGTAQEIGEGIARFLSTVTAEACRAMKYGTTRFFVELIVTPEDPQNDEPTNLKD